MSRPQSSCEKLRLQRAEDILRQELVTAMEPEQFDN